MEHGNGRGGAGGGLKACVLFSEPIFADRHTPRRRGSQYAADCRASTNVSGILDRPVKPGEDSVGWGGDA